MSLRDSSILVDGTVATTSGTATTLKSKGNTLDRHDLMLDDGSSLGDQTLLSATIKSPKVSVGAPSGYTQARNTMYLKVPFTVASGLLTSQTVRIEIATDIETTDAQKLSLRVLAAQLLSDSDYTAFWDNQLVD